MANQRDTDCKSEPFFVFDDDALQGLARQYQTEFAQAQPFPHLVVDDFLPTTVADRLLADFPGPESEMWLDWRKRNPRRQPKKLGVGHAKRLANCPPYIQHILGCFNSFPFLNFLQTLTGIDKLLPDPYFHGGGLHQILGGGRLDLHADFNALESLDLYRHLNVLFFLNKNWKPEYQGNLELWRSDLSQCEQSIAPIFNRLVVFRTNTRSFHGHPKPLVVPDQVTRKSLALYYYTAKPLPDEVYDNSVHWINLEAPDPEVE